MAFVAPAGTRIGPLDIAAGALAIGGRTLPALRRQLTQISTCAHAWPMSSARAAMAVVLGTMRLVSDPARNLVIVPGYTCYSVPAAVHRAGLRPLLCDIDPDTLGIDVDALDQIDPARVLAVVSSNLYGIPNDLARIEIWARRHGVMMLDDAAQALGAMLGDRPAGSFGDAGLYSFDKGKNIATIQGGAIVAHPGPLAEALDAGWRALPSSVVAETAFNMTKLTAYALLLNPTLYGLVRRIPMLALGQTRYETHYSITRYSGVLAGVATRLADRLQTITAGRVEQAHGLREALRDLKALRFIEAPAGARPVYLRLPVRLPSRETRDAAVTALERGGIGATASYPQALIDVPEVAALLREQPDTPVAREVANTIMTLPTHAYCPPGMPARVRSLLGSCLGQRA